MAAITPLLEANGAETPSEIGGARAPALSAFGDFGKAPTESGLLNVAHAGLTRLVWNRNLLEEHLLTCQYWVEEDEQGRFVLKIDKPLPKDVRPWKLMTPSASPDTFKIFSVGNAKMATLSWDLPAGAPATGGACPGATAGQTTIPAKQRRALLDADAAHLRVKQHGKPVPFHEVAAICQYCYASGGNFDYSEIQAAAILRYWWSRDSIKLDRKGWIDVMVEGILRSPFKHQYCKYSKTNTRPVRVHSSGDFFSQEYARAWMEVANRVAAEDASFRFWAPTRTWALPGFDWPSILEENTARNFVVRPSAYHVGDAAPEELAPGFGKGSSVTAAPGSTFTKVLAHAAKQAKDDRFDFDCPAYSGGDEAKSCAESECRACWTKPEWSVNYTFH